MSPCIFAFGYYITVKVPGDNDNILNCTRSWCRIALLLEKDPTLTREEIENPLQNTSDKIGTLDYDDGRSDYYGYGKINTACLLK